MQSTCFPPSPTCNRPTTSSLHLHLHLHRPPLAVKPTSFPFRKSQTQSKSNCSLTIHPTSNCSNQEQEKYQTNKSESYSYSNHNRSPFDQFPPSIDINATGNGYPETENPEQKREEAAGETPIKKPKGLFAYMWWVDLKAAVGQRINVEGIFSSAAVFVKDRHLIIPQVRVPDIRYIDWIELHRRGFKGVVFDKDNTITVPYSLTLWDPLGSSIELCKSVFGNHIAVFSNSAGLCEYDHDGSKARALEKAIGIAVIRHRVKKPAGTAEEVEKHFGCKSSQLIMVGDRPFTDIVYGNRNGFLTILTEPLSHAEEPFIVMQVRKLEVSLMNCWVRRGLKPISHNLLPDAMQCVRDPPSL